MSFTSSGFVPVLSSNSSTQLYMTISDSSSTAWSVSFDPSCAQSKEPAQNKINQPAYLHSP